MEASEDANASDRPLTLAYFTSVYGRATDTFIRNEVARLRELGHTVHTFSVRRPDAGHQVGESIIQEQRQTYYLLEHRAPLLLATFQMAFTRPIAMAKALSLAWRTRPGGLKRCVWQLAYLCEAALLAKLLRARRVDVLHNHIGEASASVAMLASCISGIPFTHTIHGPTIFQAAERWALPEKLRRAAFTACISDFTRSQCMQWLEAEQWDRLALVRCGPEVAFLDESPDLPRPGRFVWVGRFCAEKGVPIVVKAAHALAARGVDFSLTLVGDGPMRGWVEQEIARNGLEQVTLTGWQDSAKVRETMKNSGILLAPSFAEGLPVVIMESLALGRPVITTFVAGIPELVKPGRNGWLAPAGSIEKLCDAMEEAAAMSAEALAGLGEAGREDVMSFHHPHQEVARLEAMFRQVESSR